MSHYGGFFFESGKKISRMDTPNVYNTRKPDGLGLLISREIRLLIKRSFSS